jgi:hypothetical protein
MDIADAESQFACELFKLTHATPNSCGEADYPNTDISPVSWN